MEEKLLLSVIVPVYNVELYLENCLASILAQTYQNMEILCINDGSTDESQKILERFAALDKRVVVITQENAGVSASRNRGIDVAKGAYITFVDSDDALDPRMYETLIEILEREQAQIAHCGYRRISADGSQKDITGSEQYLVQTSEEAVKSLLSDELFVGSLCNKIYRRELFQSIRLIPEIRINEDILANVQLFSAAEKIVFYDVPLYFYYERKQSATASTANWIKARDSVLVAERIWEMERDGSVAPMAAKRLYSTLTSLYRACLYERNKTDHKAEMSNIEARIQAIRPYCKDLSMKSRVNLLLMRHFPAAYVVVYRIYNRIRKPNWDVK